MTSGEHTKGADLLALADRVEKLTGPDLELDALIWCAAFAPPGAYVKQSPINGAWCIYHGVSYRDPSRPNLWEAKNCRVQPVTSSLDAAMTLVPEGWRPSVGISSGVATPFAQMSVFDHPDGVDRLEDRINVTAKSLPIALTAACLRALTRFREAQAGGGA